MGSQKRLTTWGNNLRKKVDSNLDLRKNSPNSKMSGGDWKHGLCSCGNDCESCACAYCCPCCLVYRNAEDMNKSGILYCLLSCIMPCIPILLLRGEARDKYNIEGSVCGDAVAATCCGCCALAQTASEIKEQGDHN